MPPSQRTLRPLVKVTAGLLGAILLVLLSSAILLLVFARTREQVLGSFVLFALLSAVVTFGFLGASGLVKTRQRQIGGSAAGLIIVLGMLIPFARDPTIDIRGTVYVNGLPPKEVTVYLLEADVRENRKVLEERDQGQFEFKGVRDLGREVVIRVTMPNFEEVYRRPVTESRRIRIEIPGIGPTAGRSPVSDCAAASQYPPERTVYLFDLQATGIEPERLNEFLNIFQYRLDNGIRNHLVSNGLLDLGDWSVQRCNQAPVSIESQAMRLGSRLRAPGVLWGFVERRFGNLQSLIHLTSLKERPFSTINGLQAKDDLRDLANLDLPLDGTYFAFSSFLLGEEHREAGQMTEARRCLLHALEFSQGATPLRREIEEALRKMESSNPARDLVPIGEGL